MTTTLYTILCIVVRLGAALAVVSTLVAASSMIAAPKEWGAMGFVWVGITFALAASLWLYPGWLARVAAGRSAGQVFESPISAHALQHIAFSVLGMAAVMAGLVEVTHTLASGIAYAVQTQANPEAPNYVYWPLLIPPLARIALGVALVLGSRGLTDLLQRLRGRHASQQPSEASE